MRVTNKSLSNNFLFDMQTNLQNLSKIQQQVASTKNYSKPSDNPLNVERIMQLETSISANSQYASNIKVASKWMDTTDTALGQLGTVLSNIRDNLVKSGGAYVQDDRDKINDEINQQIAQLAQILNTNFEGEYIFGGTAGNSKPVKTESYDITRSGTDSSGNELTDYNGCISLKYANKDGDTLEDIPEVVSDGFNIDNWKSGTVSFSVNGGTKEDLTLKSSYSDIDDVVKDLNSQIQNNGTLKDKINVVKTNDGNIKFLAINSSDNITISTTDILDMPDMSDMSDVSGKQLSSMDMENISSKKTIEVSQGVVLEYNATATEVLNYGDGEDDNVLDLMDRIVHHMAGQVESTDSDGNTVWKYDEDAALEKLTGEDLDSIDAASKQVIKIRSEIGAKGNRMEDLADQNSAADLNLTEVLSDIEDIDVTKKTIELSTMITVYQSCLQAGAKIMQPTLMDYIR
ncbi:flagellar hook-associated protein FlgL [Clostridium sp. cel8]|uniref:flagellar hook-associated protein FlgL n=1 Tax=Clostridium sp. cel8 TaxID=2663123 RepID=UPI0015F6167F|nr:flagellar hook-associated protein FlgL [Clostridium sp. cel8]MBA5851085.1 flagellar hook-associated protein FlgL [Clostridium sp. cel8]